MFRAALVIAVLARVSATAHADEVACRRTDVTFTPAPITGPRLPLKSQMVVWIETATGEYKHTVFITDAVGRFGIGNRPGQFDFNSGIAWPYGRRVTTFPVWAHKKPETFPALYFQDGRDDGLSHSPGQCSKDRHFCQPWHPSEAQFDAVTCATSNALTDKGKVSASPDDVSLYPPRSDLAVQPEDMPEVGMYEAMNMFDAISRATPEENVVAQLSWPVPATMPDGDYVLVAEVSREFDHNETYSEEAYPSPDVAYGAWGLPYRGQPSVIYRVPFTLGPTGTVAYALDYAGYGDPDGNDGEVRPPDATITTGVVGSGAGRLAVATENGTSYRIKVEPFNEMDPSAPSVATDLEALEIESNRAMLYWTAPGDDGTVGRAASYEVRFRVGEPVTEANFADATILEAIPAPEESGTLQSMAIERLLFDTEYSIGIRATDNCGRVGPLAVTTFRTAPRAMGEVDACFVATAAYGSVLAADVSMLRSFRDRILAHSVLGQLFIQTYYTFAPTLSGVIAESDPLRELARDALGPIVERVRGY